jgi:hypothetical protein
MGVCLLMSQAWNSETNTYLKMELCSKANGRAHIGMAMGFRYGLMELNMKDSGKTIKHMEKESFGMRTGMFSMVSGKRIRLMAMAFTLMLMAQSTKVIGSRIYSMGKESSSGLMAPSMTACTTKV